jgi:hypothetical protein
MAGRTDKTDAGRVAALRRRIENWRRTRQGLAWMPEDLWAEAVSLARSEGAYAVARDLKLSYGTLRKRLKRATRPGRPRRSSAPARGFVEVGGGELLGALSAGGSVIELMRSDGAKLMVRLSGAEALDMLALSEAFFGRRR